MEVLRIVFFFIFLGLCNGETCSCIAYLISEDGLANENKVIEIDGEVEEVVCDGNGLIECRNTCTNMFNSMSDNGKLCVKMPGKEIRIADWMCSEFKRDLKNGRIGVFAENCQGDPMDTGFRFLQNLFCRGGYALYC